MSKIITPVLFLMACVLASCKDNKRSGCASQVCTEEFRSVTVQFVDKNGGFVELKELTTVNQRTGQPVVAKNIIDPGFSPNLHFIAFDANKNEFSDSGDDVKVTATSKATNKTATGTIKIAGGICSCHISKVSGPDKIVFDQ